MVNREKIHCKWTVVKYVKILTVIRLGILEKTTKIQYRFEPGTP